MCDTLDINLVFHKFFFGFFILTITLLTQYFLLGFEFFQLPDVKQLLLVSSQKKKKKVTRRKK